MCRREEGLFARVCVFTGREGGGWGCRGVCVYVHWGFMFGGRIMCRGVVCAEGCVGVCVCAVEAD